MVYSIQLADILKDEYDTYPDRHASHIHLKEAITGIPVTDVEMKLPLNLTQFDIFTLGGFSFDEANYRIYWDRYSSIGKSLPSVFLGDAGIAVTAGISGSATLTMMLKVNGNTIIETPLTYTVIGSIQGYGANSILVNDSDINLLQPGSYYEVWAKAGPGESLTVELSTLNVTIKRD